MMVYCTRLAADYEVVFSSWQVQYGKHYSTEQERQLRLKVFTENLDYIHHHNKQGHSYECELEC